MNSPDDRLWNTSWPPPASIGVTGRTAQPSPVRHPIQPAWTGRPRSRRILVAADEWFPRRGGLSALNRGLCTALAAAGSDVYCLVPESSEAEREDALSAGVRLVHTSREPGLSDAQASMLEPVLPDGVRPDAVIGHGRITGPRARTLVKYHYRDAVRFHLIHMAPEDIEWHKPRHARTATEEANANRTLELTLAGDADFVVPIGPVLAQWLKRERYNLPTILRIDPGFDFDEDERTVSGERPMAMIMGRMADQEVKGVDLAARAFGAALALHGRDADWDLLVRGVQPETGDAFQREITAKTGRPGARVIVRPYASEPRTIQADLRSATLLLMPSLAEGYGLVAHEALTLGTPALVSEHSGLGVLLTELLPPELARGIVVPLTRVESDDVARWGHRIAAVLESGKDWFAKTATARAILAEACPWRLAAERLLAQVPERPH